MYYYPLSLVPCPLDLYLIALSGGADSVALALMMKEQGLRCHALHCNFHLRGEESDRDEQFVRDFCQEQDIPLEVKHFNTLSSSKTHGVSIEMEARRQRYEWFAERATALGAEGICVAHHIDDQAETLLLNLLRGTGLRGLSAMHPDRTINGLRILRPLLNVSKEQLLRYLAQHGQTYVTDSTNLQRDALRNKIRLDVMPLLRSLNPNIAETLARTAENVRMEMDPSSAEQHYHRWLSPLGFNRSQILDIYAHRPTLGDAEEDATQTQQHTGKMWHSATHTLLLHRGEWVLKERKAKDTTPRQSLKVQIMPTDYRPSIEDFRDKNQAFIDADLVQGNLELRPMVAGDRFRPYGMQEGTKLVSDYLADRHINRLDRQMQCVACDSSTSAIVWLVGREIDHRYRVCEHTNRIARISIEG